MENASKALIIAGGILIAIMLLSTFTYVMTKAGMFSNNQSIRLESEQLQAFNQQFEAYRGRTDLTIHDIISAISLAKANNSRYEDSQYKVEVILLTYNYNNDLSSKDISDINKMLSEEIDNYNITSTSTSASRNFQFIEIKYNEENGRVSQLTFKPKT